MAGGNRALRLAAILAATLAASACSGTEIVGAPVEILAPAPAPEPTTTTTLAATTTTTTTLPEPEPEVTLVRAVAIPPPLPTVELAPGTEGKAVVVLQEMLTRKGFFRQEVDGEYGPRTTQAVLAFQKETGAARTGRWLPEQWQALDEWVPQALPERIDEPDRMEINLTRQVAYLFQADELAAVLPVASGNGDYYQNSRGQTVRAVTPRGDFTFYRHVDGWRISYLGALYQPWYFRGGYAIHGSNSVPAYPASHGCVRVPNWDADWLLDYLELDMPVHVWDEA